MRHVFLSHVLCNAYVHALILSPPTHTHTKVPDSTYDMIGGAEQQIKEIKEVRGKGEGGGVRGGTHLGVRVGGGGGTIP